jgi:DNA-binding FrmR family transcriptional regulator
MNSAPESLDTAYLDTQHVDSHHPEDHPHSPHSSSDSSDGVHSHIHDEASLRRLVNRLSRIEGHIRGIKTMIQEHRPCPEVLTQVAAVRGALDKVACTILDEHLTECVVQAAKQGDSAKIDQEIAELRSALKQFF